MTSTKAKEEIAIKEDSSGNHFVKTGNIRVSFIKKSSWEAEGHGIRIQAYRDLESDALHMGAELHLPTREDGYGLIAAIALLMAEARP